MSGIIIRNVRYFDGSMSFKNGDIFIKSGRFHAPFDTSEAATIIDGAGLTAIPGLIDIHLHGCGGDDVCDNSIATLENIARYELEHGIVCFMPATMTLPLHELEQILNTAAAYISGGHNKQSAQMIGIRLEGPFINPAKCGAQDSSHAIICDPHIFEQLMRASGSLIRMIDLAPETEGALELIRYLHTHYKKDIITSLAHTNADYDCAMKSFELGASHITHLYNAMPPLHHRNPGLIAAASDNGHCTAELICDGIHVHPSMIRMAFKLFSPENIIFISDSMRATGLSDGSYTLGGQEVLVKNKKAVLAKDGSIAGSVCDLMDCLRYAIKTAGIPQETAIACATLNPARKLGLDNEYGCIKEGLCARLLLVNDNYEIIKNML
jgi:N-acetylglucosamine-6-phosphate deacetylase